MQPKIVLEEDSEDDDIYVKKIKELKLKKLKMNSIPYSAMKWASMWTFLLTRLKTPEWASKERKRTRWFLGFFKK